MAVVDVVLGTGREAVARTVLWSLQRSGDLGAQLLKPQVREDPYPQYDRIREQGPLVSSRLGLLTASHPLVEKVLRDPRFGHGEPGPPRGVVGKALQPRRDAHLVDPIGPESMIMMDAPDHTRLRRLVTKVFTPRAIERLRPRIERLSHDLLDGPAASGSMDLVREYSGVLPVLVICEVLGIPTADRARFSQWGAHLAVALDLSASAAIHRRSDVALAGLSAYFTELFAQRRAEPGDDLISELLAVEEAGDSLTSRELMATCLLLLVAGFETTTNLLGNGVLALLRHPEQLALLRAEPELLPGAVEEMLRYDSSVQLTSRTALADVEHEGLRIPAGAEVITLLAGANRDPAVFPDPGAFDVTRANARRHLALAAGAHHCLGAALARLEGEVALGALLERFGTLTLDGEPRRRPTFVLRGLQSLPLRGTPAGVRATA